MADRPLSSILVGAAPLLLVSEGRDAPVMTFKGVLPVSMAAFYTMVLKSNPTALRIETGYETNLRIRIADRAIFTIRELSNVTIPPFLVTSWGQVYAPPSLMLAAANQSRRWALDRGDSLEVLGNWTSGVRGSLDVGDTLSDASHPWGEPGADVPKIIPEMEIVAPSSLVGSLPDPEGLARITGRSDWSAEEWAQVQADAAQEVRNAIPVPVWGAGSPFFGSGTADSWLLQSFLDDWGDDAWWIE